MKCDSVREFYESVLIHVLDACVLLALLEYTL